MVTRNQQHQLEDFSRAKYQLLLPENWVIRDKYKDYGIDAEVEIFDKNNLASGLVYWVQLKATEIDDEEQAKNLDFKIDTLKYYKNLEIPVLIARYSKKTNIFYCKWENQIDLYYAKENAKTIRIKFNDNEIWKETTPQEVELYLSKIRAIKRGAIRFPISIYIKLEQEKINEIPRGVLLNNYRKLIKNYISFVKYTKNQKEADMEICIDKNIQTISLASVIGCTFHKIDLYHEDDLEELIVKNTLIGVGAILSNIGQNEMAGRIFLNANLKYFFLSNKKIYEIIIPRLIHTSHYDEIINSVCEIIESSPEDNYLENILSISIMALIDKEDKEKSKIIQKYLDKILLKYINLNDQPMIGTSHYNLGNYHRSMSNHKKAIHHYLQARLFNPDYLNRNYFFSELGGILFDSCKYRCSAELYKESINKGASIDKKPLYADALMLSGKYLLAYEQFSEYLKETGDEYPEWNLKQAFLNIIVNQLNIKEQTRNTKDANQIADIANQNNSAHINIEILNKALEKDMLCALALFNLGIIYNKNNSKQDVFCFTLSALITRYDVEAWVNSTICCFNNNNSMELLPLIISTAYYLNEDNYLESLCEKIIETTNSEFLEKIADMIEDIIPSKIENKKEIRMRGEDGIYRDILNTVNI